MDAGPTGERLPPRQHSGSLRLARPVLALTIHCLVGLILAVAGAFVGMQGVAARSHCKPSGGFEALCTGLAELAIALGVLAGLLGALLLSGLPAMARGRRPSQAAVGDWGLGVSGAILVVMSFSHLEYDWTGIPWGLAVVALAAFALWTLKPATEKPTPNLS